MPITAGIGSAGSQPGVCTSTTRPTTPYEGQIIYETDTDRTLVWNNSAWVSPNSNTANPPALEMVMGIGCSAGGTASNGVVTVGSAVSSVTVTNAFSSTYDNYKITINGGSASSSIDLRFNFDGNTAGYYSGLILNPYSSTGPVNAQGYALPNGSYWNWAGNASTNTISLQMEVSSPFLAKISGFSSISPVVNTAGSVLCVNGYHNSNSSFTGFRIQTASGTITGGTIRVYGYRN